MGDSFGQSCRTFAQTGDHVANCTGLIKRLSGARLILNVQIGGVGTPSVSAVAANVFRKAGSAGSSISDRPRNASNYIYISIALIFDYTATKTNTFFFCFT